MYTIKELQTLISAEAKKEIDKLEATSPHTLYQPIGYALRMGGKRLRPVMVLLACNLFADDVEKALPAALAVEVFHNFTLLHDDIMDRAEMRRNAPTVFKKYNENIAILSGDAMSIMAYDFLSKSTSGNKNQMLRLFTRTALQVCEGQQLDMDFEQRPDVSIPEYIEMITLKTAVLLACSLKMGALAAAAPAPTADMLYDFGLNLGIAFQIQDDLLDVFADPDKFGKKIGGDIVSNKKTFLLLKALELSETTDRQIMMQAMNQPTFDPQEKISVIKSVYEKLNIRQLTEENINRYHQRAMTVWENLSLDAQAKTQLLHLAQMIMDRDH
jgi:geranylgeranyl diphosphate synthase type II